MSSTLARNTAGSERTSWSSCAGLGCQPVQPQEIIQITRRGRVAAVIMSADDLESLNETLHALRTPGIAGELRQADADYAAGNAISGEQIRQRSGLK